MSASPSPTLPYERQLDLHNNRLCGAASLSMIYRSFSKAIPQAEIWPRISKLNRLGSVGSATYLMAQDALSRGFAALAIQARHPLQVLRLCRDNDIRAVLNHRIREDSPAGHYTVLVEIDGDSVVVHDPYFGPSRRLATTALLELWQPRYPNAEITGNMLIGIAEQSTVLPRCQVCGTLMPPAVNCPTCGQAVALQPAVLLGCVGANCPARMWNYVCCPFCDYTWSFSVEPSQTQEAVSEEKLWNLDRVFGEIDKFCAHVLSLPAAANRSDMLQYLDFLKASKDKLKMAQTEELSYLQMRQAQLTQLQQQSRQDEASLLKQQEEINQPAQALDGNALGQALLKDLGLLP
jgi:hypothetical protein